MKYYLFIYWILTLFLNKKDSLEYFQGNILNTNLKLTYQ